MKNKKLSEYLNKKAIQKLGEAVQGEYSVFDKETFVAEAAQDLDQYTLTQRGEKIAEALHQHLPPTFDQAAVILLQSMGPTLDEAVFENNAVFFYLPHSCFLKNYGLAPTDFDRSMQLMCALTQRFTAEYAIRPFLQKYPSKMLLQLQAWVQSPNQHIRRLVSEGTRPRLPWASRLSIFDDDYQAILQLLGQLRNDPERYVQRSVANHLNDLTKDRKALVLRTLKKWQQSPTPTIEWITKHALRTLVKKGDQAALQLLGYSPNPKVQLRDFCINKEAVGLGEDFVFTFSIHSTAEEAQKLMIDYKIHFQKANGKRSPKVFKFKKLELAAQATQELRKKIVFRPLSTRKLYAGKHAVEIQVNGQVLATKEFVLNTY